MRKELLKLLQGIGAGIALAISQQAESGGPLSWRFLGHVILGTIIVRGAGWVVQKYGPAPAVPPTTGG